MKICIDERTYEGSAAEIMEQLRQQTFDPTEYPDTESYICQRRYEIVRKRRRNFVVFRRGGNKTKRFLAQKECSRFAVSDA